MAAEPLLLSTTAAVSSLPLVSGQTIRSAGNARAQRGRSIQFHGKLLTDFVELILKCDEAQNDVEVKAEWPGKVGDCPWAPEKASEGFMHGN